MFKLNHRIERYDARGRRMMLPKLVFTIESYRTRLAIEPYELREFSYVWLAVDEPTDEQLKRIIQGTLYQDVGEIYGAVAYAMTIGAVVTNDTQKGYVTIN